MLDCASEWSGKAPRPTDPSFPVRDRIDTGKQAIALVVESRRKVERVPVTAVPAVSEREAPKAIVHERLSVALATAPRNVPFESNALMTPSPKLPMRKSPPNIPQPARRHDETPGRIEIALRREAPDEVAVQIKYADIAIAGPGFLVDSSSLFRVRDIKLAIDVLDVERCVTRRQRRIGEGAA